MKPTAAMTGTGLAIAGVVLAGAMLAGGCQPKPATPDQRILHARAIVVDLRKMFEGGKLFEGNPQEDARMVLVVGILRKVHHSTIKNETDQARRQAILARLDEAIRTVEEVAPKWQQAVHSRSNTAAKDLVPYMQKLETQLNQVAAALQGTTP